MRNLRISFTRRRYWRMFRRIILTSYNVVAIIVLYPAALQVIRSNRALIHLPERFKSRFLELVDGEER